MNSYPTNDVSLKDCIEGRYYDWQTHKYYSLPPEWKEFLYETYRAFLLSSSRRGSKRFNAIASGDFSKLKSCGLYGRLNWSCKRGEVEYIAGQDYCNEMNLLRQLVAEQMLRDSNESQ